MRLELIMRGLRLMIDYRGLRVDGCVGTDVLWRNR